MSGGVGYGSPPRHTRFQKGRSGNPGGRRKTSGTIDAVAILDAPVTVQTAKGPRPTDPFAVLVENLFKLAIKGDMRAAREVFKLCNQAGMFKVPSSEYQCIRIVPDEWDHNAWRGMWNKCGPPPWAGPLDGLVPEERRKPGAENAR